MAVSRIVVIVCSLVLSTGLLIIPVMAAPPIFIPSTNLATLNRQRTVMNFGRNFGTNLGQTLLRGIHSLNHRIVTHAVRSGSPQGTGLSNTFALPLRLGATASNLFAPLIVRDTVTQPIQSASTNIANWLGYLESNFDRFSPSTRRVKRTIDNKNS